MDNYNILCEKLKALNISINSKLSSAIIEEYKNNNNFNNLTKDVKTFSKGDFTFTSFLIEKKIPKRKTNANHLNYSMQKNYCSYLFVDHKEEHFNILLSNSDSLNEEEIKFSNWIIFFNQNNIDVIFEKILNLLETRI